MIRYPRFPLLQTAPISTVLVCFLTLSASPGMAQVVHNVVKDETLATVVSGDRITGGRLQGRNLFHSFRYFDIGTGRTILFADQGASNIFSRVTGGLPSNIDGKLKVDGSANLFLINPNGIIFGSGASLDLSGSFMATTANSVLFDKGGAFSASNPTPILNIDADVQGPIGLQFEGKPGGISVERAKELSALTVQPGKTLALIGGDIRLNGASLQADKTLNTLRALSGKIILGGLAESGVVQLSNNIQDLQLYFPNDKIRSNVSLSSDAKVNGTEIRG
jgi:filamentous hemagglutinin family protein